MAVISRNHSISGVQQTTPDSIQIHVGGCFFTGKKIKAV
jgi:hypothetical protein